MSKYKKNDGWVTFKLPLDINQKLRDLSSKTRLSLTAIVCRGIEGEWEEFEKAEEAKRGEKNEQ